MEELKFRTFQEWYEYNKDYMQKDLHYIIRIYSSFCRKDREVSNLLIEVEGSPEYILKTFGSFYMHKFYYAAGLRQTFFIQLLDPNYEVK